MSTETYGDAGGTYIGVPMVTNNIKELVLKPGEYTLGYAQIYGSINGLRQCYFQTNYTLVIQPESVHCLDTIYVNNKKPDYNYILFNDPVCIKATTGFPKEVYKWRYSYKTSKGINKSGTFEPYYCADNGATIYVKAADFMSEADFNDLVESQNAISIIPDGATGYYKPLSVKGINVTARLTAPKIKSINFTNPLCFGDKADSMVVNFDRRIYNNETVIIELENSSTHKKEYQTCQQDENYAVFKNIEPETWNLQIFKADYINTKGNNISSYSESSSHSKTITITAPEPVTLGIVQYSNPLCYGDSTGSIAYNVTGGTGSKTCYLVDTANGTVIQEQEDTDGFGLFEGLPAGDYQLYATDQNGCVQELDSTIILQNPLPLQLVITATDATVYGKNNGKVKLQAVGGVAPYTISFMEKEYAGVTDEITLSEELYSGNYIVSVVDANSCFVSEPFTIAQPDKLLAYVTQDGQVQCFGDATASLVVDSIIGGIAPYTIAWYAQNSYLSNQDRISDLSAGTYNLTVTDAAGALYEQEVQITSPSIIHLTAQTTPASCQGNVSGSIALQAEGGNAPYAYFLNDSVSATGKFTQLTNGTYVVSVEDKNGCLADTLLQVPVMDGEGQAPQANFVVAGQVPLHDDVHLVNIMDKAAYDSIVWIYPQENVWLYEQDDASAQLIFLQEGEYLLGMRAYKGYCSSTLYKKVKAIEQASTLEASDAYLIENFSIDQSPNSGNFTTYIELNRATDVHLCVYNATTGLVVKRQQLTGSKCYEQSFEFNVPTGEYILFITIPEWQQSRYIKFVIY